MLNPSIYELAKVSYIALIQKQISYYLSGKEITEEQFFNNAFNKPLTCNVGPGSYIREKQPKAI